jgi:glycosyltransferase involved in cell wall biosynthesis
MKILILSPYPPPSGGIATWTKNLLADIAATGYDNEIIHHNTAYNLKEITKFDLWSRIIYGFRELRLLLRDLETKVHTEHPDVIHLTSSASLALIKDYFIIKKAAQYRIPVITHWRFGRIPELAETRNWEWKLLNLVIRNSAYSIVIDERSYKTLIDNEFNNVVRIPNFLGLKFGKSSDLMNSDQRVRKSNSVLYVGHLIRKKGVFELVNACAALPEVGELIMAGEYETGIKDELMTLARMREDGKWLTITGNVGHDVVQDLMSSVSILTLPSHTEGFPNVLIEGMAMGCAIVATNVGAVPEILAVDSDNPCGICIPAGNTELLRDALSSVLADPDRLKELGGNGEKRVQNNYTFAKVFADYDSVWQKAFSERSQN